PSGIRALRRAVHAGSPAGVEADAPYRDGDGLDQPLRALCRSYPADRGLEGQRARQGFGAGSLSCEQAHQIGADRLLTGQEKQMKTHKLALIPGDGIGVDVTDAAM